MSRPVRRLASVAIGSLILVGCAIQRVELPLETPRGQIAVRPGRPGFIVAAPHGSSDLRTSDIATEVARRTGFGLVVASGFELERDTQETPGRRFQVNRPFEGRPSRPPSEDIATEAARRVYDAYERSVRETAQGALRFYAEIHGNNRPESSDRIEIATVGVDPEFARRLRTLAELVRDAHLRGRSRVPRLVIAVEPADPVFYGASGAKRDGILKLPERALHIELPKAARVEHRELYTAIVADFVAQAVSLPRGR